MNRERTERGDEGGEGLDPSGSPYKERKHAQVRLSHTQAQANIEKT